MDRINLSQTSMRTKNLSAQPVELLVGQVLDVPLHVYNARTKSYRDAITNDGPVLDVNGKSARGAIGAQVVDQRRQIAAAAQLDMRASAPRITAVETHAALGEHEVIEIWSTARVIGSRSCRPWLPPSGAGIETGSHYLA